LLGVRDIKPSARAGLGRRLDIRVSDALGELVLARAQAAGAPLSAVARQLLEAALDRQVNTDADSADAALVGLGALVAAEHCIRLLELSFPQLARRAPDLRQDAVSAAQVRLEELRRQLDEDR
jgi:hypothetical protein